IVAHKPPRAWKAARSVIEPKSGKPWIRLDLRGERPLNETTRLRFRYHLTGSESMTVSLAGHEVRLSDLKKGEWAETTAEFPPAKAARRARCASIFRMEPSCSWTTCSCTEALPERWQHSEMRPGEEAHSHLEMDRLREPWHTEANLHDLPSGAERFCLRALSELL